MQFLNNLSKTIQSQKTADTILIDADIIIIFLQQVKVKKSKKLRDFNEIFGKNVTYGIKSDYKRNLYTFFRQHNF